MSYMLFRQACTSCGAEWNASFGIVGRSQVGVQAKKCPKCGSEDIKSVGDGWRMKDGSIYPVPLESTQVKAPIPRDAGIIEAASDLVALWKAQKISGASRSERNAAIETARERLIKALDA